MSQKNKIQDEETHIFLALLPPFLVLPLARRLRLLTSFFININPSLKKDLKDAGYGYSPEEYVGIGFISYNFLGALIGFLLYFVIISNTGELANALLVGIGIWFVITFLFSYLVVKIPGSNLNAAAVEADRSLMYALKDLVLHTDSGATLFEAMVAVANSDYGVVSKEFDKVVREINVGIPVIEALEKMVDRLRSEYFKKAGWQLINIVKTGSDLDASLAPIIAELNNFQKMQIQSYSRELNLWSLMYMMFSVAIPTIGSTMLVVLSAFANFGISRAVFIGFVVICVVVQVILIQFVKSRRPNVQF